MRRKLPILLLLPLLAAGCRGGSTPTAPPTPSPTATPAPTATTTPTVSPVADIDDLPTPTQLPDYVWQQLLGRDDIEPIYDPIFISAAQAPYEEEELVMGVEIEGQAKAYPVGLLNQREIINDELAGIPILVTW